MEAVDDPMARLLEPYEAASMALEVVLGYVANYIDEAALQESVLGRIVETCVEDCLTMVGMAEVSREGPAAPGSWELDAEPQSCPCDTWARGALPVKQRPKPVDVLQTQKTRRASIMAPGGSTGPRSVANVPVTGGPKSRHGGAASVASFNSRRGKEPGRASAAPAGGEEGEEDYESRLRKELEYRRQQQMAAAQSAARDADERSRLVSIAKELRGKDFAYDHKGEVVVLNKLDPEKLPPADLMLTFKVVDQVANATGGRGHRRSSILQPTATIARPQKPKDKLAKQGTVQPDFVPLTSAGDFVRGEIMNLQAGVSVRYGGAAKTGPPRDPQAGRSLTKSEYFSTFGGGFMAEEVEMRPLSPASRASHSRPDLMGGEASSALSREPSSAVRPLAQGPVVDPDDPASVVAAYLRPTSQDRQRIFHDGVPSPDASARMERAERARSRKSRERANVSAEGRLPLISARSGSGASVNRVPTFNQKLSSPREERAAPPVNLRTPPSMKVA